MGRYSNANEKKSRLSRFLSTSTELGKSGESSPSGNGTLENSAVLHSAVSRLTIGNGVCSLQGTAQPYQQAHTASLSLAHSAPNQGIYMQSPASASDAGIYHSMNRQLELLHRERCLRLEQHSAVKTMHEQAMEQALLQQQASMQHVTYSSASSMLRQVQFGNGQL